jgi:uncharacterized protein (DUF1330 family)
MKHLIVVESKVKNPRWIPEYFKNVIPLVSKFGGKYLTRTPSVELLEGGIEAPQYSVIAEFPSKESALEFYNSEEYKPFKEARQAGADSKILLVGIENGST